jgi:phage-related protein
MREKRGKVRAAQHRRSRKHYAVAVTQEVHTLLHVLARHTQSTPGEVIRRSLLEEK